MSTSTPAVIPAVIPVVYTLLSGGENGQAPLQMLVDGSAYHWASPVTPNTWQIEPQWGCLPPASYAIFRVNSQVQTSDSALFRLAAFDDGLVNPIPLAYLTNSRPGGGRISNDGVLFTDPLNAVLALNTHKNIGWQLAGDNTHPVIVYNVRCEVGWQINKV